MRLLPSAEARGRSWWRSTLSAWRQRGRAPHSSVYVAEDLAHAFTTATALVGASMARVADAMPITILPPEAAEAVLYRLINGGCGHWTPGMRTDARVNWRLAGEDVAAERRVLHVSGAQIGLWSCVAQPTAVTANALEEVYALPAPLTVTVEWRPCSAVSSSRRCARPNGITSRSATRWSPTCSRMPPLHDVLQRPVIAFDLALRPRMVEHRIITNVML